MSQPLDSATALMNGLPARTQNLHRLKTSSYMASTWNNSNPLTRLDVIITRLDVAKLALKLINDEGKKDKARVHLDDLAYDHASGRDVGTKCLIYNSIGATMTFYTYKDWSGNMVGSPYPVEIKNGQWGFFFHVTPRVQASSHGAIVYYVKDQDPNSDPWGVLGWFTGWGPNPNYCYAELQSSINGKYYKKFEDAMNENETHHHISTHGNLQGELTIDGEDISEWTAIKKLLP